MATLNKISEWVNRGVGWLLIFLFSLMTVAYFGQIVLRYVFSTGLVWTEELTRYCQVALIMFGAAMLAGQNKNINVSLLEALVSPRTRKWVVIGQQVITGLFFLVAIKISFDMIGIIGGQVSTNMRVPMKYVYSMFPVAFTILVFNVIVFILNTWREPPPDENPLETSVEKAV